MNQIAGSYLLHEFDKRIISNIEQNNNIKCFGEIFNDITYRMNTNKKQIKNIFDNNARYVKLCKNDQYFDNDTGNDDVTMGIRRNNNNFSITHRSMKLQPITHITVERVNNNELQPSVIGSYARKDKCIGTKKLKSTYRTNALLYNGYYIFEFWHSLVLHLGYVGYAIRCFINQLLNSIKIIFNSPATAVANMNNNACNNEATCE